jgi:hypothetical protein
MRRHTSILMLLGVYYISTIAIKAQDTSTVSSETRQLIQNQLDLVFGHRYLLGVAVSIDSLKNQSATPDRIIEDIYGTLQHCIVFTATSKKDVPQCYGLVGIFKDNQILWRSDTVISTNIVFDDDVVTTQDLNKDGKIDIVTSWIEPHPYSGYEQWWIVSWDGQTGNFINTYENGSSSLKSMEGGFQLVDLNGDGVKEIIGAWMTNPQDDTVIGNVTYSWNGNKYGFWPTVREIPEENVHKSKRTSKS